MELIKKIPSLNKQGVQNFRESQVSIIINKFIAIYAYTLRLYSTHVADGG